MPIGAPDFMRGVIQVLERKGGGQPINQVDDLAQVSTTSLTYELKKTIVISTPTPPSGVDVLRYALMVSFRLWNSGAYETRCAIYVDDVYESDAAVTGTPAAYRDRAAADRTAPGTFTVKLYLKVTGGTGYMDNARVLCGIGTNSGVDVKVVSIATQGQVKLTTLMGAKNWDGGGGVTVTLKPDESPGDYATKALTVNADGSLYSGNLVYDSFAFSSGDFYLRISSGYVRAVFLQYEEVKTIKTRLL